MLGHGMLSDDSEHTLLVAQALLEQPQDATRFQHALARRLRYWLLALPAGVGLATGRAILKLWIGVAPERAGVFSAGNGPAMRSALLGAFFARAEERRRAFVTAGTRLTHTDPKALTAALAVAEAGACAAKGERCDVRALAALANPGDGEWGRLTEGLADALARGASVAAYADALGLARGVTGYAYHTVPVALFAWLRHLGDFRATLEQALGCGGDTDTVGAIAGALAGATVGQAGIPPEWVGPILDWPHSPGLLLTVAGRLAEQDPGGPALGPVRYAWPCVPLRNALFLAIVLTHGFRRLLPPYA